MTAPVVRKSGGWALALCAGAVQAAPVVDSELPALVAGAAGQPVIGILTFHARPGPGEFEQLSARGVTGGMAMRHLPMVLTTLDQARLDALRSLDSLASIWANHETFPTLDTSGAISGVDGARQDADISAALAGLPVSGRGIGVAVVDSPLDLTHPDFRLGENVRRTLRLATQTFVHSQGCENLNHYYAAAEPAAGFVPPEYVENAPLSDDAAAGHGTHVSGIIAGSGAALNGRFRGVAPGAHLVTISHSCSNYVNTLAAYDYILGNTLDNLRVVNNSWAGLLQRQRLLADHPINRATRALHDAGLTVVFAAGNEGERGDAINPFSTLPWVISVAAGEKPVPGVPAVFSSRGVDDGAGVDTAGDVADPLAPPNLRPDLVAPGVAIVSACSGAFCVARRATGDPPEYTDYVASNGTSQAAPHVAGVVALMLEANPLLKPDQIVTILRETATPMPDPPRIAGAGYLDARNAVRRALALAEVPHPADLGRPLPPPPPSHTTIQDDPDDLIPATIVHWSPALDVVGATFGFDASADVLRFTMTLKDASTLPPEQSWWLFRLRLRGSLVFVRVYVADALGTLRYQYTLDNLCSPPLPVALGSFSGNTLTVELPRAGLNAALGGEILQTLAYEAQVSTGRFVNQVAGVCHNMNVDEADGGIFSVR